MGMSEELANLGQLHQQGVLSDEEFARAKARVLDGMPASPHAGAAGGTNPVLQAVNSFGRSKTDRWMGGVCGGLAISTGMASWLWRLIFAVLALCGGTGVLAYILMWIFVPVRDESNFTQGPAAAH
jgi:phage shock protein C